VAGVVWEHETRSSKVPNDELEGVQRGLKARGSLLIWLDPTMNWHGQASGKRGRSPTFSDQSIQFCLSIKCLFSLPLRQAMGMTQSLLQLAGLDWPVPDYSMASRRQKTLQVAIGVVPTTTDLHLLVDSTGIKMLGEGEWKTKKHGADYRRQWRNVHLGIDAATLEIRAMEVTANSIGDAPMLPNLLGQISTEEQIASVSGDGAYDTRAAMRPLRYARRMPSSPSGKMPSPGSRIVLVPRRAMRFCERRAAWGEQYGKSGVATINVVWSRPKCAVSSCLANASWRAISIARSPSYRSVPPR
jgi:hypothetical protein